ncbi:MAG: hypothetical protein MUE52_04495 [Tabrizicola sp.]|jgi:hypothetical protein|nr:hypothetical protein [Tabrizicola sp.]
MIAFAIIGPDGIPTGGGIRRTLPEGAVPLTAPFTTADLPRLRWQDGVWVERVDLTPDPTPDPEAFAAAQLARARLDAVDRINAATDAFRRRFYTDITGQDALYLEKRAEALAYVREAEESGEPKDLADYPLIANEIGVTAPTPWQLAQIWLHLSGAFKSIGAATERPRQIALNAVALARDQDELFTIQDTFTQALSRLLQQDL